MLRTPLDKLTDQHVNDFIAKTALQESASLDYKRDYDLSDSKNKKGFVADICAFANNGGGHIIVGIDEQHVDGKKTGLPVSPPRGAKSFDKSVAEDVIHASIDPRVGSFVRIQTVPGSWVDGPVHVIRVDRTWNPPHCVRTSEQRTFYRRSGTKSEPMDINQIREAFVGAAGLGDRIREFHRSRVQRVRDGETTFPLDESKGKSIVHVVPLSYFASGDRLTLEKVPPLRPSSGAGSAWFPAPNFDGRVAHAGKSYVQVFRDGAVEAVNTDLVYEEGKNLGLRARQIEIDVLRAVQQAGEFFDSQPGPEPPCLAMFSVVGIEGSFILPPDPGYDRSHLHAIERDQLEFPDVQLDSLVGDISQPMRSIFDILWQAGGWPRSQSYDEGGSFAWKWQW